MAQLQDLLQTHAVVKILDHLTLYKDFEYTKTDIANETGISRRTLYQVWPILERFDLVKVTKSSGMIKFYKLNTENPISKQLIALADKISFFEAEKMARADLTPLAQAILPTPFIPSQDRKAVKITAIRMEGTPSQVKELIQGMLDLTNGEITIPVADSTGFEPIRTKKKKEPGILRLHSRMESK